MEHDPSFFPAFMAERPELWPHLAFYSEAFADLSADRQLGAMGGAGQVPWSSIDRYADRYEIDDLDDFDRFRRMIRAQDRIYLEHMAKSSRQPGGE
ncbi:phage tail assembly chaperone [Methylobacterium sp. Leaf118]|uniref:phage tail assembly chaperone n=1 Tax=Methylobacterium sp. Leaf118 TaxID=2876562 RepID=UPI001E5C85EC|nr:hypothetical protein [Methylobacterium sp. Leaf118]